MKQAMNGSHKFFLAILCVACFTLLCVTHIRPSLCLASCGEYRVYSNSENRNCCNRHLPGALIIGAAKCGTAALATFLGFHPRVAILGAKELDFFSRKFENGFKWYQENMPCSVPGQVIVERSSSYFHGAGVPSRVKMMSSDTKLILIVCEPVRRIVSAFSMQVGNGVLASNASFEEYFFSNKRYDLKLRNRTLATASKYSVHLSQWFRVFPEKQIHIVDGDKLSLEPWAELKRVEDFLGVDRYLRKTNFILNETKGFYCVKNAGTMEEGAAKCLTETKGRKHIEVKKKHIKILKDYLQPYNEKFYKMAAKKFNW